MNANFALWQKKLQEYGCFSQEMMNDLGEKIKVAPFCMSTKNGMAYEGALLETVLYRLCSIASLINENVFGMKSKSGVHMHPHIYVNNRMLMRVLLLQHIAKAVMFTPEVEEWKKRRGDLYMFNDAEMKTTMKLGQRSAFLCMKYGIELCEEEFEAIHAIDKTDDGVVNSFVSPLAWLVKVANQVVAIESYRTVEASKD